MTWAIEGYEPLAAVGHGSTGVVVSARESATGTIVAVKFLSQSLTDSSEFLVRYRGEVSVLGLIDHDHIVNVYEFIEQPGRGAVVTELVGGLSLRVLLQQSGPLEPEAAFFVVKGMLLGLHELHSRGIMHRALRPENVLIDAAGTVKIVDIGLAVPTHNRIPANEMYAPPELWTGEQPTPSSDVHTATAVLFECLTGQVPRGPGGAYLGRSGQPPDAAIASIPRDHAPQPVKAILTIGLATDPQARPAVAQSALNQLDAVAFSVFGPYWDDAGRTALLARWARAMARAQATAHDDPPAPPADTMAGTGVSSPWPATGLRFASPDPMQMPDPTRMPSPTAGPMQGPVHQDWWPSGPAQPVPSLPPFPVVRIDAGYEARDGAEEQVKDTDDGWGRDTFALRESALGTDVRPHRDDRRRSVRVPVVIAVMLVMIGAGTAFAVVSSSGSEDATPVAVAVATSSYTSGVPGPTASSALPSTTPSPTSTTTSTTTATTTSTTTATTTSTTAAAPPGVGATTPPPTQETTPTITSLSLSASMIGCVVTVEATVTANAPMEVVLSYTVTGHGAGSVPVSFTSGNLSQSLVLATDGDGAMDGGAMASAGGMSDSANWSACDTTPPTPEE